MLAPDHGEAECSAARRPTLPARGGELRPIAPYAVRGVYSISVASSWIPGYSAAASNEANASGAEELTAGIARDRDPVERDAGLTVPRDRQDRSKLYGARSEKLSPCDSASRAHYDRQPVASVIEPTQVKRRRAMVDGRVS